MTLRQKQCLLMYLGYYQQDIDGIWGAKSAEATADFQKSAGLSSDGDFGPETERAILEAIYQGNSGIWDDIRHFSRGEFSCRCGRCGGFPAEMDLTLLRQADDLRERLGVPIHVSSGVRCNSHNIAVGGVANSRHLAGKAMDFRAEGLSAARVLEVVDQLPDIRYAYAIDENYVHMDVE